MADVSLCTGDATSASPGLAFSEVLGWVQRSKVSEIIIVLDCCFGGSAGGVPQLGDDGAHLRSGVSILAASRGDQAAVEHTTVYTGTLSSLKRFKDDVREVREGLECGIGIENFNDLKVGDRIESFRMEEIKRTLQPAASGAAG